MGHTTTKKDKYQQDKFFDNVREELQLQPSYVLLLVFSTIIATLGLMINSTAVVIGAMIISPLFWPIMGVALSIFNNRRRIFTSAVWTFVVSMAVVISMSAFIAWISPTTQLTAEIIERTRPTLIDLFIALASSVIGVIAIYYPRISSTAAGVAISIALLPPLAVSGIGIALADWDVFYRSLLLFGTNVVAMLFAGIVTLYLLQFRPSRRSEVRFRMGLITSFLVLLALAVPLSIYLQNSFQQNQVQNQIDNALEEQVMALSKSARLEDVSVDFVPSIDDEVDVTATVYLPEGQFFTETQRNTMIAALSTRVGRTVNLRLSVVNTLQLRREEDQEAKALRAEVEELVIGEVRERNEDAIIESMDVRFVTAAEATDGTDGVEIDLLLRQNGTGVLSFAQKEEIQQVLGDALQQTVRLEVELIPVQKLTRPDESVRLQQQVEKVLVQDLQALDSSGEVVELSVEDGDSVVIVDALVRLSSGVETTTDQLSQMQSNLQTELESDVQLTMRVVRIDDFAPTEQE